MADDLEERLAALRKNLKDPPMDKRVDPLKVMRAQKFRTTFGSLRAAVESNPDHPVALAYAKALRGQKDTTEVTIDQVDLEALLDDLDVINEENPEVGEDEEGEITRIIVTKRIGEKRKPKEAATRPTPPMTETQSIMQDDEMARHTRENTPVKEDRPAPVVGDTKDPKDFNQLDPQGR